MARKPQRIIEAAVIENIGPVTAYDLITMPENSWGLLRDRITDHRNGKDGLDARCMRCGGSVYIRTIPSKGISRPLFAHYSGSDPNCPWHHGRNTKPDHIRASQYQGQQESDFHRLMCDTIAEIVALDKRHLKSRVDKYLPPTENSYGRFPDVYVEWEGFEPFVIEFQFSNTFQTEISQRCKHYEREGMALLWVLFGIDPTIRLQQSFKDVIRRHRGNAFVLDQAAIKASKEQKTLVLNCYLASDEGLKPPVLVRFDELTIPKSKLPYFEDRIVEPQLATIKERRRLWFQRLESWDHTTPLQPFDRNGSLLIAAVFSIIATANNKKRNFASRHPNIKAMLNTYMDRGPLAKYAVLLDYLLQNTACNKLLDGKVGEHLRRCAAPEQATEDSKEWLLLKELVPEVFDPVVREELSYLDALPDWAKPITIRRQLEPRNLD